MGAKKKQAIGGVGQVEEKAVNGAGKKNSDDDVGGGFKSMVSTRLRLEEEGIFHNVGNSMMSKVRTFGE